MSVRRASGACDACLRHGPRWLCRPCGRHRTPPPLARSANRSVDVSVSFHLLDARDNKGLLFTSLPSAGAVCEKETFQFMKTREKSQHVSTLMLYACAHREPLSSICDTRKWSQHNFCKPSDKFASW